MCISVYTYQQRLEYARKLKRLHELYVIKDNIHLTYKYKNQNKAIHNAHSLQDNIINSIIDDAVYGNANAIKNIDSTIEKLMTSTLENERKRIHHQNDKYVNRAVELNSERYTKILTNRINTEAIKLERKIESELRSGIHNSLNEAQTRTVLQEKYQDTAKARIRNIIRDSVHTNESNISFINALNEGYNYKIWMNGRSKGKTRAWHKAKLIAPVPIEEYFDIYGPYGHKESMYPGDLYSGAENVANCRCWLRYTNRRPEGLSKTPNTYNIPNTSYLSPQNKPTNNANKENILTKPLETFKTRISNTTEKVTSKIKQITKKTTSRISHQKTNTKNYNHKKKQQKTKSKNNLKNTQFKRDLSKSVTINGKTAYGVGESKDDKKRFGLKYGISANELTTEEYKFIKLYSEEGFDSLNSYMRETKGIRNLLKRRKLKNYWSNEWDKEMLSNSNYMPMMKTIKVGKQLFKKGKILENDLVVVRRQNDLLLDYAENGVYTNDAFLSTSISKNVIEYGEYVNYIRIPKGEKILYIELVSSAKTEYELLLAPGKTFHFVEVVNQKLYKWSM